MYNMTLKDQGENLTSGQGESKYVVTQVDDIYLLVKIFLTLDLVTIFSMLIIALD